jgi:hypothetical protein
MVCLTLIDQQRHRFLFFLGVFTIVNQLRPAFGELGFLERMTGFHGDIGRGVLFEAIEGEDLDRPALGTGVEEKPRAEVAESAPMIEDPDRTAGSRP